ncbi:MAG: hypothetical protein MJZ58_01420 [Paludibacteraceae bacterium]|nr:hypothetical protein [Paludibacteraceae bacterium]
MKKNLFVVALLLCALTISAREYQHSVGIVAGNSFGLSYKGYVRGNEHFVIETNLTTKLLAPGSYSLGYAAAASAGNISAHTDDQWGTVEAGTNNFLTFEASPNFYYQAQAADLPGAVLNWYAGGGIGVGTLWLASNDFKQVEGFIGFDNVNLPAFKVDEHAVVGVEFCFKKVPLNLSIDFRPGCGEFVYVTAQSIQGVTKAAAMVGVFFDWTAGVALRYRIGK